MPAPCCETQRRLFFRLINRECGRELINRELYANVAEIRKFDNS